MRRSIYWPQIIVIFNFAEVSLNVLTMAMQVQRVERVGAPLKSKHETRTQMDGRIAQLDAVAFQWLARGREANIEVGRAFNALKKILGHGQWLKHFAETFAPSGINLRTAENYMRRAREADSKIEKTANLKPASDEGAKTIRHATEQAQAEVDELPDPNKFKQVSHLYNLPLRLTNDERNAIDALRKSSEWTRVEKRIVRLLRQIWNHHAKRRKANPRRP